MLHKLASSVVEFSSDSLNGVLLQFFHCGSHFEQLERKLRDDMFFNSPNLFQGCTLPDVLLLLSRQLLLAFFSVFHHSGA